MFHLARRYGSNANVVGTETPALIPTKRFSAAVPGIRERFRYNVPAVAGFAATDRVSFPAWRAYPVVSANTFVNAGGRVGPHAKT